MDQIIGTNNALCGSDPSAKLKVYGDAMPDQIAVFAKTAAFAPVTAVRNRDGAASIGNSTLRSAVISKLARGNYPMVDGFGADISFDIENCVAGVPVTHEIGNVGAIRDGNDDTGKLVFRAWNNAKYWQYDALGNKVLAASSAYPKQGWNAVMTSEGNMGIFEDNPKHRLHIKDGGADVGDYLILGGKKLEVRKGKLYFDNCKVTLECPKKCKKAKKSKRHSSESSESSESSKSSKKHRKHRKH
jgi:hypothetical protein